MINLDKYVPIESTQYPGFYIIPGISKYVVNTVGDVKIINDSRNKKAGDTIANTLYINGYINNYIIFDDNSSKQYGNHRLICLAFYGPPGPEQTDVNHIDGISDSNYFKNLCWCTHQENMQHSYDIELRNSDSLSIPVLIWDTINDRDRLDIRQYSSISETARRIGITNEHLSQYLLADKQCLIKNRYVAKYIDNPIWLDLAAIRHNSNSTVVSAKNIHTGKIYTDVSVTELSKQINVKLTTVVATLKRDIPCALNTWLFAYGDTNIDWDQLESLYYVANPDVVLYNTLSDQICIYNNATDLAHFNNLRADNITRVLRSKRYRHYHYLIYYINDKSEKLIELKRQYAIDQQ